MVPLPECASGEWGPAKAYRLFGLIPLTHEDAIINCGRELEISFRMVKPLAEFVASLHMNQVDDSNLQGHYQTIIRGNIVKIQLDFYEDGQYGLDIYTRENSPTISNGSGKQLLTHCCKYLINVRI
ncbi:Lim and transglutaminase domain protein [Dirofilaria immitis]